MFRSKEEFTSLWSYESASTQKMLDVLTDEALAQPVAAGHWSLGELAWHLATVIHEMMSRTGLQFEGATHGTQQPSSAKEIAEAYRTVNEAFLSAMSEQWTDASLQESHDMYGQMWPNAVTLQILMFHQIHHRGQMTVLMRQAGLKVPGVYGPSKEEWQS